METTTTEKPLNDAQRGALAGIIVRRYDDRIEAAEARAGEIRENIEKSLARPFDPEKVEAEIKRFRAFADSLEARKRELNLVRTLIAERDEREQRIWLANTVEEAHKLIDEASGKEAA